jgi:hypothetical protein
VFVGDTTPDGFQADRGYLRGLSGLLDRLSAPPVGVVFQANKRDLPNSVPVELLRGMLADLGMRIGVVESVATDGTGIREAFVLAVRLALDRVRELMRLGQLQVSQPTIDTAQDLLHEIQAIEAGSMDLAAHSGLAHTRLTEVGARSMMSKALAQVVEDDAAILTTREPTLNISKNEACEPLIPNDRVASGMIWPPVDGRAVLNELASAQVILACSDGGDWTASVNARWNLRSAANAVFGLEEGRSALVQFARIRAANAHGKSVEHCIALAPDGHGRFRLWTIDLIKVGRLEDSVGSVG